MIDNNLLAQPQNNTFFLTKRQDHEFLEKKSQLARRSKTLKEPSNSSFSLWVKPAAYAALILVIATVAQYVFSAQCEYKTIDGLYKGTCLNGKPHGEGTVTMDKMPCSWKDTFINGRCQKSTEGYLECQGQYRHIYKFQKYPAFECPDTRKTYSDHS